MAVVYADPTPANNRSYVRQGGAWVTDYDPLAYALGNRFGFQQAGSGAVLRTYQAKLFESVSAFDYIPVAQQEAISAGTSTYDCTADIQDALNEAQQVLLPAGTYNVNTNYLTMTNGQRIIGQGRNQTTINNGYLSGAYGLLYADSQSATEAGNLNGIYIADLTLNGQVGSLGYSAFTCLVSLNGVTDCVIERVDFLGFRGDGLYIGSGPLAGETRHNFNVTVCDCTFNGVTQTNRNGISIIDCDGLLIDNCVFENIGNPTLSSSVGAIDFEPDNTWNVYRDCTIRNCRFYNINSTNTAAITFHDAEQVNGNICNWIVENCEFNTCYIGIQASSGSKNTLSVIDNLTVAKCHFLNTTSADMACQGLNKVNIMGCVFEQLPIATSGYQGGINVGYPGCFNAIDWTIRDCKFNGLLPPNGAITIYGAVGLTIENNVFNDVAGNCIDVITKSVAGTGQIIDNFELRGNVVNNKARYNSGPTTSTFITTGSTINDGANNNQFINHHFYDRDNIINDAVSRSPGGTQAAYGNGSIMTATPASGSWSIGTFASKSSPAPASTMFMCTAGGTFGTFTTAPTVTANGTATLIALSDTADSLRAGQFVKVGADTTARQVIDISGTTVTLASATTQTGSSLSLAWGAPAFISA
jgi:hypothetical protein